MKPQYCLLSLLVAGCNIGKPLGENETGFGSGDEVGELPGNKSEECYGLGMFDLDPLMEPYEQEITNQYGGINNGEIACYTPDPLILGDILTFPNPTSVPDMSEGIDDVEGIPNVETGVICNFLLELPGTMLGTEAGGKLPWYTGPFINALGQFTARYTACGEPCGAIAIASNVDGKMGVNEFCQDHLLRHSINPDGNIFNDGTKLANEQWCEDEAIEASRCQAPSNALLGEIPPILVNAQHLPALANTILDTFGFGIIPDFNIDDVPWTWNFMFFTGLCEFDSFGYKAAEEGETGLGYWAWGIPCPNNYFTISEEAILQPYQAPYDYLWVWGRSGYCYMDGLTVSGNAPPPDALDVLAQLESDGVLPREDWKKLLLVQHGGGQSWPADGIDVAGFDANTATIQIHPDLIDYAIENPTALFEGVSVRKIRREDGSGDPKPAIVLVAIPEDSMLDALGYRVGDVLFSVRGKDGGQEGSWANQFANLDGDFSAELTAMLGLTDNRKAITLVHERLVTKKIPSDHAIRVDQPNFPETVELAEMQERHFFRWEWASGNQTP